MKHFALLRLIKIIIISQCFVVSAYADTTFTAVLNGAQQTPSNNSTATGAGSVVLNAAQTQVIVTLNFSGLTGTQTVAQIQNGEPRTTGPIEVNLPNGNFSQTFSVSPAQVEALKAGLWYFNVRSTAFPNGEIRGQIESLCAPPTTGMIAWYRSEDNANDSIGGKHGTLQNGAKFTAGKVGQAFNLDGTNDYINVADTPSLRPTNLTVSGWFNFSDTPAQVLVAKTAGMGTNESFVLYYDGAFLGAAVGGPSGLGEIISFPFNISAGGWYHIAYTFDDLSNAQALYINGAAVAGGAATASIVYDAHPITIGAEYENEFLNYFFKGKIDEVQIFDRALSASEIQSIYHGGSAGVCTNSVFTSIYGNGKIAFSSNRTGINQIFTMNSDGSNQINVSNNSANPSFEPASSPDGGRIAFSRIIDNNYEVYVMNSDGGNQTRLTNNPALDAAPHWSPDGTKIVFFSDRTGGGDIYVMNADGTNQTRLTTAAGFDLAPKFSPDGSRIAFVSSRDGNREIYVMNSDGANQTRVTTNSVTDEFPAWSPDGSKIVFLSTRTGNQEIFVINADGSNPVNLSNNPATDSIPAWSPDGSKIAFETNRDSGNYEIYVMNADGTNQTRFTNNAAFDSYPAWQPVGNVTVSPAINVSLTFPNVTKAGYTVATPLLNTQIPRLTPNFFLRSGFAYDIRTSALYTGGVNVQFAVPNVHNAETCSSLRILQIVDGNWDMSNNSTPTFNQGVCTLQQTVTSLSPFVVVEIIPAAEGRALSGNIIYGTTPAGQPAKFVPGVSIVASGPISRTATTDSTGGYLLNNLNTSGSYTVTPLKTGSVNGITPFDATLILRCVAAGASCALSENQRIAADTNNSNSITPFDATLILRFVAANGQTTATGQTGTWKLIPNLRSYNAMLNSLSGENYTAILVGEVNGNWTPPTGSFAENDEDKKQ
ncbi:MAG TPA: LamG-like jellyroll fold domain-containing protein [Pyrinomonadaceae bacterium]|jgi:Tol biopolymer transport system component